MHPTQTAYGTWNGGRFMHFGEAVDEDRFTQLFQRAYEKGIRTFMTADVYGSGKADTALGKALAGIPRDSYCLVGLLGNDFYNGKRDGSKGFPRFTDPKLRGPDGYTDFLEDAAAKSLERCNTDHFDLVLLHNPDHFGFSSEAVWDSLRTLKQNKTTEMLGIAPGPANGFALDIIQCYEKFGDDIDWAMIILNALEPWPARLSLAAAEKHKVNLIARVVDHGGLFHGDVKPGHRFAPGDHRAFRAKGWVEHGNEKIDAMRPIMERHGLSPLHFACHWTLGNPGIQCVVPTLIQEAGEDARPIEDKVDELASLAPDNPLSPDEIAEVAKIGDNTGCMPLKGGTRQYQGEPQADQWPASPDLEDVAKRWNIEPDRDLYCADDPRDKREKAMPAPGGRGVPQASDARLYVQLQVFTDTFPEDTKKVIEAVKQSGLITVVYANVADPRSLGILILSEDPDTFVTTARDLFNSDAFETLTLQPEFTMFGRTYGFGREPNLQYYLTERPIDHALNPDWPWAVWYPLRRKGTFYRLPKAEQTEILKEHGMIGFQYGGAGYAGDIRLTSFGIDKEDNEFILGILGPRLDWLSKLVEDMRPTVQTSEHMDKLGPFFVGKVIHSQNAS
ncbi:MAG: chlorite dismutase family protein [Verrucomicrobiota bacterium]